MKIIISHDVDHLRVLEHRKDLLIPKHIMRNFIEYALGYVSGDEIMNRFKDLLKNQWHNLESLMEFDNENAVPSTFFFGVANGKGLNYTLADAEFWINKAMHEGFDIGVHGIAFETFNDIREEYEALKAITALDRFGIRMHYLRCNSNTLDYINKTGYLFDSSIVGMRNYFKVGTLWEFPLHLMDGHVFCRNARWHNQDLKQSIEKTKLMIEEGVNTGIDFLTILFHDRYFSDSFIALKDWYIWLIKYLKDNKLQLTSYDQAVRELNMFESNGEVGDCEYRTH